MDIARVIKHLFLPSWRLRRAFSSDTLGRIERAITVSEAQHTAEIRFAVESALDSSSLLRGQSAHARAVDVFSKLRVWDTEANDGVLIYLLLADRVVEIVCDRAAHAKIDGEAWSVICRMMEVAFEQGNFENGVISGIEAITQHLIKHFPRPNPALISTNELSNTPAVLYARSNRQRHSADVGRGFGGSNY